MSAVMHRATLAAVYTATELYYLTDQSAGYEDTWAFLERRLAEREGVGGQLDVVAKTMGPWLQGALTTLTQHGGSDLVHMTTRGVRV